MTVQQKNILFSLSVVFLFVIALGAVGIAGYDLAYGLKIDPYIIAIISSAISATMTTVYHTSIQQTDKPP